jgi:hypothetical protein
MAFTSGRTRGPRSSASRMLVTAVRDAVRPLFLFRLDILLPTKMELPPRAGGANLLRFLGWLWERGGNFFVEEFLSRSRPSSFELRTDARRWGGTETVCRDFRAKEILKTIRKQIVKPGAGQDGFLRDPFRTEI